MPKRACQFPQDNTTKKKSLGIISSIQDSLIQGEVITDNTGTKWKLGKAIGIGGFGEIYNVVESKSSSDERGNCKYVAKIEKHTNGPLFVEINCYLRVAKIEMIEEWKKQKKLNFLGLPHFVACGSHTSNNEKYRFLIIPKYDEDLEAILRTKHIFNLKTTLVIASQIIDTLEYIHSHGYVHSDIKASNIMLKHQSIIQITRKSTRIKCPVKRYELLNVPRPKIRNLKTVRHSMRVNVSNLNYIDDIPYLEEVLKAFNQDEDPPKCGENNMKDFNCDTTEGGQIYLLDYGLASKFLSSNGEHRAISSDQRRAHAGTMLFCSRDAHEGILSRRSDLESLAYNIVYWLTGTLPWMDVGCEPDVVQKRKNRCFSDIKSFLSICFDQTPKFLVDIFEYLKDLKLTDTPDYDFLRRLFKKTIKEYGYVANNKLDFDNLEGWGHIAKKVTKKENKYLKKPNILLYSPLRTLSSNIQFKRPKLRKKIKNKVTENSMMNWSKILMDPETIRKQFAPRKMEEEKFFNILELDIDSLDPTPAMRAVFNRASEREDRSPLYRGDEPLMVNIEGYTPEMMRVHSRMIEQRELKLQMANQPPISSKKTMQTQTKMVKSSVKKSSKQMKQTNKEKKGNDKHVTSQYSLRKSKWIPLK